MEKLQSNVFAISYAKRALTPGSRERKKLARYATRMPEHHVLVFTKAIEGYPPIQQEDNLYLYATNARTKVGMLFAAYKIGKKIIRKNQPATKWVVSSQDPFESALVARAIARATRALCHVQIHGDVFNPMSYKESLLQRLRILYGRHVVRHTKHIRVVSKRIQQSLCDMGVPASAITILPVQADLDSFLAVGENRQYGEKQLHTFLYCGRFSEEKNLLLLVRAFSVVVNKFPQATLCFVGEGPVKNSLQEEIIAQGVEKSVVIKPWTDNLPKDMSTAEVFCLTSNHEGWGMVLLEAAAAGMAIVTTNVGCAGECIVAENSGIIVPVNDKDAYVQAMMRYQENKNLVAIFGKQAHQVAQTQRVSESNYLDQLVRSFSG